MTIDRRTLLGVGLTSALGAPLLAACGSGSDTGSSREGRAEKSSKRKGVLPKYKAYQVVEPDLPGEHGSAPGFTTYPTELVRAVEAVRGKGSTFNAMTPLWGPPPASGNPYYTAVAEATGSPVKFSPQDGNSYQDKLTAILGAGDIPDVLVIPGWNMGIPGFGDAVQKYFADLTPFLAGDIADRWPMLANLPTEAWQFCVWRGKLMSLPSVNDLFTEYIFYRKDLFDELGAEPPSNADELYQVGKELTSPKQNRWAFGDIYRPLGSVFGVPGRRGWRLESDGSLVNALETDEFAARLEFTRRLYDEQLVHPDFKPDGTNAKELLESGRTLMQQDGLGAWTETLGRQLPVNPDFDLQLLPPFAHDGGTPVVYGGDAAGIFTFVNKNLPKAKAEEFLDLADWCAAPFGTVENQLLQFGVEDTHFTVNDDTGAWEKTTKGEQDVQPTYFFLGGRPVAITESQYPGYVESRVAWGNQAAQYLDEDIFAGIRIEEPVALQRANQPLEDRIQDILRGRSPLSDLDQVIQKWRSSGGDEGRAFYENVLEKNS